MKYNIFGVYVEKSKIHFRILVKLYGIYVYVQLWSRGSVPNDHSQAFLSTLEYAMVYTAGHKDQGYKILLT